MPISIITKLREEVGVPFNLTVLSSIDPAGSRYAHVHRLEDEVLAAMDWLTHCVRHSEAFIAGAAAEAGRCVK